METLFNCCKKVHSKRLLKIEDEQELINSKKKLNNKDIIDGIELFKMITDKKIDISAVEIFHIFIHNILNIIILYKI